MFFCSAATDLQQLKGGIHHSSHLLCLAQSIIQICSFWAADFLDCKLTDPILRKHVDSGVAITSGVFRISERDQSFPFPSRPLRSFPLPSPALPPLRSMPA